jgi:hypothetical protein
LKLQRAHKQRSELFDRAAKSQSIVTSETPTIYWPTPTGRSTIEFNAT